MYHIILPFTVHLKRSVSSSKKPQIYIWTPCKPPSAVSEISFLVQRAIPMLPKANEATWAEPYAKQIYERK